MLKKIFFSITFILLTSTVAFAGYTYYQIHSTLDVIESRTPNTPKLKAAQKQNVSELLSQNLNILILGIDSGGLGRTDQGRSDAIFLMNANFESNKHQLFSFERDLLVPIANLEKEDKLNAAYAFGGPETAIQTLENLLKIDIPYYLTIDFKGFDDILKIIGPVEVNNPLDFDYDGHHFNKGKIKLEPHQALAWVRMRYDDPDGNLGRQRRQQELIKQISSQLLTIQNLSKLPKLANTLGEHVQTNLPLNELILALNTKLIQFDFATDQVTGDTQMIDGGSYEIISDAEINRIQTKLNHTNS